MATPTNPNDLSTVANLQQYLQMPAGVPTTETADELQKLLTAGSVFFLSLLNRRSIYSQNYVEWRNGTGGDTLLFKVSPATAVSQVLIEKTVQTVSTDHVLSGYAFDADRVFLYGSTFPRGTLNVQLSYTAGWIPVTAPLWAASQTVAVGALRKDTNGNIEICTTAGVTQTPGPPAWPVANSAPGIVTVDGTAAWTTILPDLETLAIERAALELCAQKWKRRMHVDENTHTIGGQFTTSFGTKDLPSEVKSCIDQFKRVIPIY